MKRLTRDKACYALSRDDEPVLHVAPGEVFCVETQDAASGKLKSPQDVYTEDLLPFVNPATGPIHVEGAQPGDLLRVDIERIDTNNFGVMALGDNKGGPMAAYVQSKETSFLDIDGGTIRLRENLSVPIEPMIGVIGTAPDGEPLSTLDPGEHGGNMDCKEIAAGASVYLPVAVEGGLLALGDLHALMGDGEVATCGADLSGEVVLSASVLHAALPTPCVETEDHLIFIGSAKTLDECERIVLNKSFRYLTDCVKLAPNEAVRLMSLVGDLGVCQVVSALKTMKFKLRKSALTAISAGGIITGT